MQEIVVETHQSKQVVDITDHINDFLVQCSKPSALCHAFVLHTTAALTTADLDPGTDLDMLDAFEAIMPRLHFRHLHNPAHVPDHIWASIIGPSLTLPIGNGKLVLGTWQRVVLIEFDGPRERKVQVNIQ